MARRAAPLVQRTLRAVSMLALGLGAACTSAPATVAPRVTRIPPPAANVTTPPLPEPTISPAEARAAGEALLRDWSSRTGIFEPGSETAFLAAHGLDEAQVRTFLEAVTRPCLEERNPEAEACRSLRVLGTKRDPVAELFIELAGEAASTEPGPNETLALLVKLDARGAWRATSAIERALERRMIAGWRTCAPPSEAEIEVARSELGDVRLVLPGGVARAPTSAELDDLAYFQAATRGAGKEVGTTREDDAAPPLPKGSPERARRAKLRAVASEALLDGAVARHAAAAAAYLTSLGWPGPIRVAEDEDERWGGAGFSYALRDWARSEEILGRLELAEALRRRAAPGGGACGTSTPSVLADQIEGVIRSAELRDGCRSVVAERLFTVSLDLRHSYGPDRLARAGFDVARLYRAALLDTGGPVDWTARVRAIAGYGDVAGREAIPRLLELAERGPAQRRIDALETIGRVVKSHGIDPCRPSGVSFGAPMARGERDVRSIMNDCATRLDEAAMGKVVAKIAALSDAADPGVREAVARALGRTGSPRARAPLQKLARDRFDATGTVCTSVDGGPQTCRPNQPVQIAAEEALRALDEAAGVRRQQLAEGAPAPVHRPTPR